MKVKMFDYKVVPTIGVQNDLVFIDEPQRMWKAVSLTYISVNQFTAVALFGRAKKVDEENGVSTWMCDGNVQVAGSGTLGVNDIPSAFLHSPEEVAESLFNRIVGI